MAYTVKQLGRLAGVSARTLRYYDEIGLLKPARINSSGYRIYGQPEVDRLQQILFYRELGLGLEEIKRLLASPDFDEEKALLSHRAQLLARRAQIDQLIVNVERTLAHRRGVEQMSDKQKFAGFKREQVEANERQYGAEIRAKYGDEAVERANNKLLDMSEAAYRTVEQLSADIHKTLAEAFATGDPAGELAQHAADLHRQWLTCYWDRYDPQAHANLAQMYVDDARFTAYYDKDQPGTAAFLRDAIQIYTRNQQ